ncbi:MAG: pseudaminic acid synthase [Gammaproteobacteria bacterium 39-13]|nr:pseudaminic acid synthase [Gammaproteobacteria bacterium]OJV87864.1 MAG: pseudaminic acid synthase [Gammaproteobacteria bacterium 39-13]
MTITIANRKIGSSHKPFIIAEMSANHEQSLDRALMIVEAVAKSGADAIKLQTLKPENITLDMKSSDFFISDEKNLWSGQTLYELYQKAYLPWEWHAPIFEHAKKLGLIALSTPFDLEAVDFLESLNVPCYKIGSCENRDIPLIQKVARTGKPVIISTGMASASELAESVQAARDAGCRDLILTKCTCAYPSAPIESNLRTIPHMKELFNCEVGLSDHSEGIGVSLASVALGASVIEKHITLTDEDTSLDAVFSLTPSRLKDLVIESTRAWEALGKVQYGPTESEVASLKYRRSLYVCDDVAEGELLTHENVRSIRPSFGLAPKFHHVIIGKRASKDLKKGEALTWEMVS